jgi:hypothetical protein
MAPSMRLDVQLAGRGDEQRNLSVADDVHDPRTHFEARPVEVLADVGKPLVWRVGVVGDHRNTG